MSFNLDTFDMEAAASKRIDYDQPVPAGSYRCKIVKAEHGSNKAQTGTQLYTQYEICEGPHKGRRLQTWMKTSSQDKSLDMQQWVEDDKAFMATLFKTALGRKPRQFSELVDQFVEVRVGIKKKDNSNQVRGFSPLGNAVPAVPSVPQAAAPSNGATQAPPVQPWHSVPTPQATVATVATDDVPF